MKAVLLSAGLGTRLRPITDHTPKCLVSVLQKPLLAYWLDLLLSSSCVEEVFINTHYLASQVQEFIQTSPWSHQVTLLHEPVLLGTAGTILKNRGLLPGPFLLAHADNLTRFDVAKFLWAHENRRPGIEITMMTFDTDQPECSGIVQLDEHDVVVEFYEKQSTFHGTRANAAVYIIAPSVISFLASLGKETIDMSTEVLPHYLGRIQAFHNSVYHRDIGSPTSLQLAEREYARFV